MTKHLHIVCLDAPSPPDYGGAIDMHYKIKALAKAGIKIILHYFNYNPTRHAKGLENDCDEIHVYKRKPFLKALPLSQPFIVSSRINNDLIKRLNADNHPVLLEGLHCTGIVPFVNDKQRIVVRMHNEEAAYYAHLAKNENSLFKRTYFLQESRLLQTYQQQLDKKIKLACLSSTDIAAFKNDYGFSALHFVPCFIPWQNVSINDGVGSYCLYHGNMSVSENREAATWLVQNVFSVNKIPFIIAGKGMSPQLLAYEKEFATVQCINNPSIDKIDELVRGAQINVLPSMNATGVKLKLLNALLNGRHCITNGNGVMGSGLEKFVIAAEAKEDWLTAIQANMQNSFTASSIEERKEVLTIYNNGANARKLSELW